MAKKERAETSPTVLEGTDYALWLKQVPAKDRRRIAGLLKKHRVQDYGTLVDFSQAIMIEIISGNLTPVVARELRYWAELLFTIIATENTAAGTPEAAQGDVVSALLAVAATVQVKPLRVPERERVVLMAEGE